MIELRKLPLLGWLCTCVLAPLLLPAQTYTSYFTGRIDDVVTTPTGGVCLMGGARENDEAMRWFLRRAGGGDVLVLRTSGSDGYNDYFYSELGVALNSVETIVFHEAAAATDPYVLDRIRRAEAVWFAGGDQARHLRFWAGTQVQQLLSEAVTDRQIAVGGTSAGMAILGGLRFTARNGTIRSPEALADPFDPAVTLDTTPFLPLPYLENVLTDTHFDNPDRRGRLLTFLARLRHDRGRPAYAIAAEEYTAVCIDAAGRARSYGEAPAENDAAYFLRPGCDDLPPETIAPATPLTWEADGQAVVAYFQPATPGGSDPFGLTTWLPAATPPHTGEWQHWTATAGQLRVRRNRPRPDCLLSTTTDPTGTLLALYPNPAGRSLHLSLADPGTIVRVDLLDARGRRRRSVSSPTPRLTLSLAGLPAGPYFVRLLGRNGRSSCHRVILAGRGD